MSKVYCDLCGKEKNPDRTGEFTLGYKGKLLECCSSCIDKVNLAWENAITKFMEEFKQEKEGA